MTGCQHYLRWYIPVCQECIVGDGNGKKKITLAHSCHHCHNEEEYHEMDRSKVKYMKCILCGTFQEKSNKCKNPDCYAKEHRYTCLKCSLWEHKKKDIYHCDGCGICRIGKEEDYKHCDKCNICWDVKAYDTHPCKIDQRGNQCMICLEDCWDSQSNPYILKCGHIFHPACVSEWFKQNYTCPTCKKSAFNPAPLWEAMRVYVENSVLPDEVKDWKTKIHCNDCEKKSVAKFHPAYHKCQECESWNTTIVNVIKE